MSDADLLQQAQALLQQGKPAQAKPLLVVRCAQTPDDAEAHNALGTALAQLGDADGAEQAYRDSIRADASLYKPHANLGNLFARNQRWADACEALSRATELQPQAARLWFRLGQARRAAEQNLAAAEAFETGHRLQPEASTAAALGEALLAAARPEAALDVLSRHDPRSDPALPPLLARAADAVRSPLLETALAAALALDLSPQTLLQVAHIAKNSGHLNHATELAAAAAKSPLPEVADDAFQLWSDARGLLGDAQGALEVCEQAFASAPSVANVVALAAAALALGLVDRATAPLQASRVLFPTEPAILTSWSKVCAARGDLAGAVQAIEAAAALADDSDRALALEGRTSIEAAAAPTPSLDRLLWHAELLSATLQPDQAVKTLARVSAAFPHSPCAHERWAVVMKKLGRHDEAAQRETAEEHAQRFGQVFALAAQAPDVVPGQGGSGLGLLVGEQNSGICATLRTLAAECANLQGVVVYLLAPPTEELLEAVGAAQVVSLLGLSAPRAAVRIAADSRSTLLALGADRLGKSSRIVAHRPAGRVVAWQAHPIGLGAHADVWFAVRGTVWRPTTKESRRIEVSFPLPPLSATALGADVPADGPVVILAAPAAEQSDSTLSSIKRWLDVSKSARILLATPWPESELLRAALVEILGPAAAARVHGVAPSELDARLAGASLLVDNPHSSNLEAVRSALSAGIPVVTVLGSPASAWASAIDVDLASVSAATQAERVSELLATPGKLDALRQKVRALRPAEHPDAPFARALCELLREPVPLPTPPRTRLVETDLGVSLIVPDRLNVATTFVIQEQQRWFEDEVPFIRRLVQPGDVVVDVGANLGVYSVECAKLIGDSGRVVSFEPSSSTAAMLRASFAANGLTNGDVEQVALGATESTARLQIADSPELSQLGSGAGPSEEVRVLPLSAFAAQCDGMSFLKLDAEGSEISILEGSGAYLREQAPAVMFELKHGSSINSGLIAAFADLDFSVYTYLRGLRALVPFRLEALCPFQLNLFAVTEQRALQLRARGLLVDQSAEPCLADDEQVASFVALHPILRQQDPAKASPLLRYWLSSQDTTLPQATRFGSLERAVQEARHTLAAGPRPEERMTAARVLFDGGKRQAGLEALSQLARQTPARWTPQAPFVSFLDEYLQHPQPTTQTTLLAQTLEAETRFGGFSTLYQGARALDFATAFFQAGGKSREVDRRLGLLLALQHRLDATT